MSRRNTLIATPFVLVAGLALAACGGSASDANAPADPAAEAATDRPTEAGDAPTASAADESPGGEAHVEKRARCVRAIEHVLTLIEARGVELTGEQRDEALGSGADECAADASRAELDCVLAAGELEDVRACEGSS